MTVDEKDLHSAERDASVIFRALQPSGQLSIPIFAAGRLRADSIVVKAPGTFVRAGEVLAEKWPQDAAAPLAPCDGKIAGLGKAKISPLRIVPAVLFDPDPTAKPQEFSPSAKADSIQEMLKRMQEMDLAAGIEHLRLHGVWSDRWSGPDLLAQLRECENKPVDTVLCNALDESPDLLLHGELAAPFAMEMTAGVLALAALTRSPRPWIVMSALGKSAAWEAHRDAAADTKIKTIPLRDHYPQSQPALLIHELTGRHVRPTRLPSESGILTLDAPAAIAVGRCFLGNTPMLTVPVGVHERRGDATWWVNVPIGMTWSEVLSQLSISNGFIELRAGNPLRESRLAPDCIVAGGELSVTTIPRSRQVNPDPCIRCAWCLDGCPVRIHPAGLLEAAQQDDPFLGDQYGIDACIECGICSYVCPSHLPILTGIRALRASIVRDATKGG